MKIEYLYIEGTVSHGVKPHDAVHELERIRKEDGLTGEAVVAAAAPPTNPLHPYFEWDDARAAHRFRIRQAQGLIRAVSVIKGDEPPRRIYVNVTDAAGVRRYERMEKVAKRPEAKNNALVHLRRQVRSAQTSLDEFYRVCEMSADEEALSRLVVANEAMQDLWTAVDQIQ